MLHDSPNPLLRLIAPTGVRSNLADTPPSAPVFPFDSAAYRSSADGPPTEVPVTSSGSATHTNGPPEGATNTNANTIPNNNSSVNIVGSTSTLQHENSTILARTMGFGEDGEDESSGEGAQTNAETSVEESPPKHSWVLKPDNTFRKTWDIAQVVVLIYVAFVVPFRVGLDVPSTGGWYVFDLIVDFYFWVDVALGFITGYEDTETDHLVLDLKLIAKHYLRTWFAADLISILPVDLILTITEGTFLCSLPGSPNCEGSRRGNNFQLFKLIRLLRLSKLLRLMRMGRLIDRYQDDLFLALRFLPLVKQLFILFLLGHLTGCLFYFASSPDFRTAAEKSNGKIYWLEHEFGDKINEISVGYRYVTALYWSFTTLTTVGYGDISASTTAERVFAVIGMVTGTFYFGYVIGSITNLIQNLQRQKEVHDRKMEGVRQFLLESGLPKTIRTPILAFFRHQEVHEYDTQQLLRELPYDLRHSVLHALYSELITQVSLFNDCDEVFVTEMCSRLQPVIIIKGSMVYQKGEIGREMFIVARGQCALVENGETVRPYNAGEFFGEGVVFEEDIRTEHVRALTTCKLVTVKRRDIQDLLRHYPIVQRRLERVYRQRQAEAMQRKLVPPPPLIQKSPPVQLAKTMSFPTTPAAQQVHTSGSLVGHQLNAPLRRVSLEVGEMDMASSEEYDDEVLYLDPAEPREIAQGARTKWPTTAAMLGMKMHQSYTAQHDTALKDVFGSLEQQLRSTLTRLDALTSEVNALKAQPAQEPPEEGEKVT